MGIDSESDVSANLQIGPTTLGMVRLYIEADGTEIPLDFDPDEALEIAEEIRAAAERARQMAQAPADKRARPAVPSVTLGQASGRSRGAKATGRTGPSAPGKGPGPKG